ncbi:MAG: precorrin-3B C(17)-methyltransferase [Candidatus Magnetoovum sp. WYHC-5]|nr:precorrin-3B C(17)-methyltransferase [Candidatus Magnetoovum sp. WYHC-5]
MDIESRGKLFIVGTGPGALAHITPAALDAINVSNIVVGFTTYVELIRKLLTGKEVITTSMTEEKKRVAIAIEKGIDGNVVSLVCGGDPGIYALAGLVLEMLSQYEGKGLEQLDVEVIAGVPALNSSASRLGAPLMHDFAAISLSDRLTPWELIEKRLSHAAEADFVICIYNPKSKGRKDHLARAINILMQYRAPKTPVGVVKGATRENESVVLTTLGSVPLDEVDMHTTLIVGNSNTYVYKGWMITPRGYRI